MLNSGGIKLSTCQSLASELRGCVDAGPRGIPHVARFIQPRIEHQRDRQKNRTQPWNGEEIPSLSSSACIPGKIKEAQQAGRLSRIHPQQASGVSSLCQAHLSRNSRKRIYRQIYNRKGFCESGTTESRSICHIPVSYTHLTLPTILLV